MNRLSLEVLTEGIQERDCLLRLFLDSKWSRDPIERVIKEIVEMRQSRGAAGGFAMDFVPERLARKMRDWFPVTFTIEDACLTNSDAIWMARHGYL